MFLPADNKWVRIYRDIMSKVYNKYVFPGGCHGIFLDRDASLQLLREKPQSVIRMGDGESLIIMGGDIYFQDFSERLRERLLQILNDYNVNCGYYVAIAHWSLPLSTEKLLSIKEGEKTYYEIMRYFRYVYHWIFKKNIEYLDSSFFKGGTREWVEAIADILSKYKYIIVVKSNTETVDSFFDRFGISTKYSVVNIPPKNAFSQYDKILSDIEKNIDDYVLLNGNKKDILILTSAGPCAKVLSYDLNKKGTMVWDIGKMFECWLDKDLSQ